MIAAVENVLTGVPKSLTIRLVRYGIVGVLSTAIYFGLVVLLVEVFDWDPVVSAVLGSIATIVFAYLINYRWVFTSTRTHITALPSFIAATVVSLSINASVMFVVVHLLGWWYIIGLILTTLIVPPTNFALNYFWCFRESETPRDTGHY